MTVATPRLPTTEGRSSPMLLTSGAVPDGDRWTLESQVGRRPGSDPLRRPLCLVAHPSAADARGVPEVASIACLVGTHSVILDAESHESPGKPPAAPATERSPQCEAVYHPLRVMRTHPASQSLLVTSIAEVER